MKINWKAPKSEIVGHSVARYYQGGRYFDGEGNEVSGSQAAKPYGMTQRQLREIGDEGLMADEEVVNEDSDAEAGEDPETETAPEVPAAEVPEAPAEPVKPGDDPEWQQRYEDASKLHHTALLAMCEQLYEQMVADGVADGVPEAPFTGEGSKDLNARWVATYTAD